VLLGGRAVNLQAIERRAAALPGVVDAATQAVVEASGRRRLTVGLQATGLTDAEREQRARQIMESLPAAARSALEVRWFEKIVRHPLGHLQVAQSRPVKAHISAPAFAGGATEQAIHAVWSELLGMNHIDRNDNFFDLGGTSLTALQAVLKLEQMIGKQISPRRYVSETLAQLAAAYDATEKADATPEAQQPLPTPAPGLMKRLTRLVQRA
jgi:acyl carrier protein